MLSSVAHKPAARPLRGGSPLRIQVLDSAGDCRLQMTYRVSLYPKLARYAISEFTICDLRYTRYCFVQTSEYSVSSPPSRPHQDAIGRSVLAVPPKVPFWSPSCQWPSMMLPTIWSVPVRVRPSP